MHKLSDPVDKQNQNVLFGFSFVFPIWGLGFKVSKLGGEERSDEDSDPMSGRIRTFVPFRWSRRGERKRWRCRAAWWSFVWSWWRKDSSSAVNGPEPMSYWCWYCYLARSPHLNLFLNRPVPGSSPNPICRTGWSVFAWERVVKWALTWRLRLPSSFQVHSIYFTSSHPKIKLERIICVLSAQHRDSHPSLNAWL